MPLSVIIPSKTIANLLPCVAAIREHDAHVNVIVVDDGIAWETLPMPITVIGGHRPFIFARNVNLGIEAAGDDDVIILNDDAVLQNPHGFTLMRDAANGNPEYGVISATTNVAGNDLQLAECAEYPGVLRREGRTVAFVCAYIPREVIRRVGMLDPRFTAYGWEDNDYCRRVRETGLKIGVYTGCYVDHNSLRSTFRGAPRAAGSIVEGAAIYRQKWGDLN